MASGELSPRRSVGVRRLTSSRDRGPHYAGVGDLGTGNIVRRRWQNAKHLFVALVTAALCLALSPAVAGASATGGGTGAPGTTVSLAGNGSVDEAWLTGASPGDQITLMRHGSVVAVSGNPGTADPLGSLIIREPDAGTRLLLDGHHHRISTTNSFQVLAPGQNPAAQLGALHRPADAAGSELHHHAGRHPARGHGPVPVRRDLLGRRPVPHGHRILRVRHRRTDRSDPLLHRTGARNDRAATAATPTFSPTVPPQSDRCWLGRSDSPR